MNSKSAAHALHDTKQLLKTAMLQFLPKQMLLQYHRFQSRCRSRCSVRWWWPHLGVTHVEVPTALQDVPNLLWSRCCTPPDVVLTAVRRTIQHKRSLCSAAHRDCDILLWHCSETLSGRQLAPRQSGCAPRRRLSACCGSQEGTPVRT